MSRVRFGFEDPGQAEIYSRLRNLIGPGPADFYWDACRIMTTAEPMAASTHLVGHCIRELNSALAAVLEPAIGTEQETEDRCEEKERSQKDQLRAILAGLEIGEDQEIGKAWLRRSRELARRAHRSALNATRPVDKEFERFFQDFERILEAILARFETRFSSSFSLVDELLSVENPTREHAARLKDNVPNTLVTYSRFFEGIPDSRWLPLLRRKDFFTKPPEPEADEDGNIVLPLWPQSAYLARIATEEPQQVREIILGMQPTTNVRVLEDVADAALAMPPGLSLELVPKVVEGLDLPTFASRLPQKLATLVVHFSNEGFGTEALDLARELLVLVPQEEVSHQFGHDPLAAVLNPKPRPRFEPPEFYDQIVDEVLQPLIEVSGEETFGMLCDLFAEAVRASVSTSDEDEDLPYEDNVYFYRPAIEDHRYNRNYGTREQSAMYGLLSAVRDCAAQLVAADSAKLRVLVPALENRGTQTFGRLALYLLNRFPEAPGARELAAARLTAKIATLSPPLWHEYAVLLRTTFAELSADDQRKILDAIKAGPPEEELEAVREWRSTESDTPLSGSELEESLRRHGNIWRLCRLAMLSKDLLPPAEREEYERLFEEHGDPGSDPLFYNEPGIRSVPLGRSPVTADDMGEMTVEDIVVFLRDFVPTGEWQEPDMMDVAQELKEAVKSDPTRFTREATAVQELEPTYVRGLLWGLHEYLREANKDQESSDEPGPSFSWQPVLNLCRWVVDQPRQEGEKQYGSGRDLGWGLCRQWTATLLRDGLLLLGEVPFGLREEVWELLQVLSNDPDPTLAKEEVEMPASQPHATPYHVSINSVRGVAMHAVVAYILWVRRNSRGAAGDSEEEGQDLWRSLADDAPQVREILDSRLDPDVEPTQTIRAVYGSWLPWLVYLDRGWVEENLTKIFPSSESDQRLRRAAWNAYVAYVAADREVFEVLRPEYRRTVEELDYTRVDEQRPSPERRLAEHLMVYYWWGVLQFGDSDGLLERFYEIAPDTIRAKAAGFVRHQVFLQEDPLPDDLKARLEDLWERRLYDVEALVTAESDSEATEEVSVDVAGGGVANYSEELAAFASWATTEVFDTLRSLERLRKSLALGADVGRSHQTAQYLARVASTHPVLVIECVTYLVNSVLRAGPGERWTLIVLQDDVHDALQRSIASGVTEAAKRARELANILVARGYTRFESVL